LRRERVVVALVDWVVVEVFSKNCYAVAVGLDAPSLHGAVHSIPCLVRKPKFILQPGKLNFVFR